MGSGLLIAVDELHAAPKSDLGILLNALQNISHDYDSPPIAFVAAGLPAVRGILTAAATFGERTAFIPIERLSSAATAIALTAPANEVEVKFTPQALELIEVASFGYPYFVQLLGYNIWEVAKPTAGTTITAEDAEAGVHRAQRAIRDLFEARYDAATKSEKALMIALARSSGDLPARRLDVAAAMGKNTQAISAVRSQLLGKAVITEPERGLIQFTIPGFADFINDKVS